MNSCWRNILARNLLRLDSDVRMTIRFVRSADTALELDNEAPSLAPLRIAADMLDTDCNTAAILIRARSAAATLCSEIKVAAIVIAVCSDADTALELDNEASRMIELSSAAVMLCCVVSAAASLIPVVSEALALDCDDKCADKPIR